MNYKSIIASLCLIGAFAAQAGAQGVVVKDTLEVAKCSSQNPLSLLDGQVSGLNIASVDGNVNGSLNAYIRGLNAIHSDSQPLIILDGAFLNNALNQNLDGFFQLDEASYTSPLNSFGFLSAYEIESIEVIKDMSAAAIYGAKAANGVIIINTKLPKKGERNITWRSNVGVDLSTVSNDIFKPAISHNHTIGTNGTANNTSYNISAFYRNANGVVDGTGSNYAGLNVSFDTKANSVIWFGLNNFTTYGKQSSTTGAAYVGSPSLLLAARFPSLFPNDTEEGWASDYDDDVVDIRSVTSANMTINFSPALVLRFDLGVDYQSNDRRIWYGNGTSFGLENNGAASVLTNALFAYNGKAELSYKRFFGKHHVKAILEADADGNINKFNTMSGLGFFDHTMRANGLSIMESKKYIHKFSRDYSSLGAYAQLAYDFDKIAGIDATLRANVTTKYDDWNPVLYPAANVYLDVKKLALQNVDFISTLKLTAGYGVGGREIYVPYELFGNYLRDGYPVVDEGAECFYDGFNRAISSEYNIGLNLGVLNDKLNIGVKYYDKTTADTFSMYCFGKYYETLNGAFLGLWNWYPRSTVFSRTDKLANRGFELDLNARIIDTRDITWTAFATGSYNVNQVTDITLDDFRGKGIGNNIYVNANVLGYSVSSLYGYEEDETGAYIDQTKDGQITQVDKVILGNSVPKFFGSFGTTFRYRRATLDVLAKGVGGYDIANLNNMINDGKKELSTSYVEKGDYLRLSRVALSYDIPVNVKWINNLKVSLTGLNLLTLTKYTGWNPDVNCFSVSALSNGVDYGSYPSTRTIMLGVSANF